MFRHMPAILITIIIALIIADPFIPLEIKSLLYSISLSIKSIIITLLPIIIFGLLFKVSAQLTHQTKMIIFIIAALMCSNFISTYLSQFVGKWVYTFDLSLISPQAQQDLKTLWHIQLPMLVDNCTAMFSGIILGMIMSIIKPQMAVKFAAMLDKAVNHLLQLISCLIPFFVAGFIVKLNYDNTMVTIIKNYSLIFGVIGLSVFTYIGIIYLLANRFMFPKWVHSLKNMLPAAIAGFSTMSSASAMPLTILAAEKNAQNKDLARSIIPATVNIHLIGDCFAIPILAFAILKTYGLLDPTFYQYLIFTCFFVLAKFSVAGVPGGGIIVMLPVLEGYLGFNAPMLSLITALYILFDPVITCANVLGNGGFALLMDRLRYHSTQKRPTIILS